MGDWRLKRQIQTRALGVCGFLSQPLCCACAQQLEKQGGSEGRQESHGGRFLHACLLLQPASVGRLSKQMLVVGSGPRAAAIQTSTGETCQRPLVPSLAASPGRHQRMRWTNGQFQSLTHQQLASGICLRRLPQDGHQLMELDSFTEEPCGDN